MAILTSHILNGSDGSHGAGIDWELRTCGSGVTIALGKTDGGGRLHLPIAAETIDANELCELTFQMAAYWGSLGIAAADTIGEIALRFSISDVEGNYHMPIIATPYSYSTWKSSL